MPQETGCDGARPEKEVGMSQKQGPKYRKAGGEQGVVSVIKQDWRGLRESKVIARLDTSQEICLSSARPSSRDLDIKQYSGDKRQGVSCGLSVLA